MLPTGRRPTYSASSKTWTMVSAEPSSANLPLALDYTGSLRENHQRPNDQCSRQPRRARHPSSDLLSRPPAGAQSPNRASTEPASAHPLAATRIRVCPSATDPLTLIRPARRARAVPTAREHHRSNWLTRSLVSRTGTARSRLPGRRMSNSLQRGRMVGSREVSANILHQAEAPVQGPRRSRPRRRHGQSWPDGTPGAQRCASHQIHPRRNDDGTCCRTELAGRCHA
jgi:hypothetical protein